MDYTKNQNYFNEPGGCLGGIGILLILGSIGGFMNGDTGAALAVLVVGIALLATSSGGSGISDSEYDSSVSGYANGLSR
ncbi:MAG: hypothetical protein IJM47_00005, partial [Synergistaceae bacterium]|nr:hypothetical protein [Synergistaceae bacterium]